MLILGALNTVRESTMHADNAALISYSAVLVMIIVALALTSILLIINRILGQRPREKTRKNRD